MFVWLLQLWRNAFNADCIQVALEAIPQTESIPPQSLLKDGQLFRIAPAYWGTIVLHPWCRDRFLLHAIVEGTEAWNLYGWNHFSHPLLKIENRDEKELIFESITVANAKCRQDRDSRNKFWAAGVSYATYWSRLLKLPLWALSKYPIAVNLLCGELGSTNLQTHFVWLLP